MKPCARARAEATLRCKATLLTLARAWIFLAALRAGGFSRATLRAALLSSRSLSAALRATRSLSLQRSFFGRASRGPLSQPCNVTFSISLRAGARCYGNIGFSCLCPNSIGKHSDQHHGSLHFRQLRYSRRSTLCI